jgi:hypothetical protein
VDERSQHACCLFATDEELESDAELFDCDDCPVREALEGLWPENAEAWRVFRQIATQFTVDLHAGNEVLRRLTGGLDDEAFGALLDRLSLIYTLLYPPPAAKADTD